MEVQTRLLELLRCPFDGGVLAAGDGLVCRECGRRYSIDAQGIPLMLHHDLPGAAEKLREAAAWPDKARAEGWYEPDDTVDVVLPFVNRELGWDDTNWRANAHSFELLLGRYIGEQRGLRVLEVGAAKAWAARFWLERDCEYVATDILVDPNVGLGRGSFYGDFTRVQADGENLPFPDATFDVVYGIATLHHALDLHRMVREFARVARPGAVVAGLNEGVRGVRRSSENPDQAGEKEIGINEHVHSIWTYLRVFTQAGLIVRRIERADGWPPVPYGGALTQLPKIGQTLGTLMHASAAHYIGVSFYARRRG